MDIFTLGRINHAGYNLRLKYNSTEKFADEINTSQCFKIILIEKGNGIAIINNSKYIFAAPALFCLRNTETISIQQDHDVIARSLYFHPMIINKLFTFENTIELSGSPLKGADYDDTYCLRVFRVRTQGYIGQLNIGPALIQRITDLFELIGSELEQQRDSDWPCRSRSYLFELLFVLQQLFTSMNNEDQVVALPNKNTEMDAVLLYIHTNYYKKITVSDLARIVNINRTTLEKKFSQITGLSLISYLIKLRIEFSSKLLAGTLLPVSEILTRVGFNDRTHFNRIFNRYTGYTPSIYRKKFCWMKKNS